jgi:hypothetical protein
MKDAQNTVSIVGVLSLRTSVVLAPLRRRRPPLRATPSQFLT